MNTLNVLDAISGQYRPMPRTFAYASPPAGRTTENYVQQIKVAGFQVEPRRTVAEAVSGSTAVAQLRGFPR